MKQAYLIATKEDLADFGNTLINLDITKPQLITVDEAKTNRSLAINRLYWMGIGEMRSHITESIGEVYCIDAIHEQMKHMFLLPVVYDFKNTAIQKYSTAKLSNKEFCEYYEKVSMYCADRLHLILKTPQDLFNEAMDRK